MHMASLAGTTLAQFLKEGKHTFETLDSARTAHAKILGTNRRLALYVGDEKVSRRKRFTLMPAIVLAGLGLMVALPTLSSIRLYAASTQRYVTVTVHPGDTLWSLATAYASPSSDVQEVVDRIADANHLASGTIQPGQHLRIPE